MAALFTATEFRTHEGFTDDPPSDEQITELILLWQSWLERVTGQFFDSRALEFSTDGTGNELIQLPVPIISIDFIKVGNGAVIQLQTDEYVVYNGRQSPNDDRQNPRIKMKCQRFDIFTRQARAIYPFYQKPIFDRGEQNITIKGNFGFLEPDNNAPPLVLKALRRLVLRDSLRIKDGGYPSGSGGGSGSMAGMIIEEVTDGHKYKLASFTSPPSTWESSGDAEVDRIAKMYRRPTAMGAIRNW